MRRVCVCVLICVHQELRISNGGKMSGKVQPRAGSNISFRMWLSSQQIFYIPVCAVLDSFHSAILHVKIQTNNCPGVNLQHCCKLLKFIVTPPTISLLFEKIIYIFSLFKLVVLPWICRYRSACAGLRHWSLVICWLANMWSTGGVSGVGKALRTPYSELRQCIYPAVTAELCSCWRRWVKFSLPLVSSMPITHWTVPEWWRGIEGWCRAAARHRASPIDDECRCIFFFKWHVLPAFCVWSVQQFAASVGHYCSGCQDGRQICNCKSHFSVFY